MAERLILSSFIHILTHHNHIVTLVAVSCERILLKTHMTVIIAKM